MSIPRPWDISDTVAGRAIYTKLERVRNRIYKKCYNTLRNLHPEIENVPVITCNYLIRETRRHLKIIEEKNQSIAREIADIKQQNSVMEQYVKDLNVVYDKVVADRYANELNSANMKSEDGVMKSEDGVMKSEDGVMKSEDGVMKSEDAVMKSEDAVMKSGDGVTLEDKPKEQNPEQ